MSRTREELLQMIRGFQESRVLLTALELDVFAAVAPGARADEVASRIGASPRGTSVLLDALVGLGALDKREGLYHCTPASKELAQDRIAFLHSVRKWDTWSTLTECVRTGTTARKRDRTRSDEGAEAFIGAMRARALPVARQLVDTVGGKDLRRMLDLGGGPGTFTIAFAERHPDLEAEVLDRPEVVPIAQRHILAAGLAHRVQARVGDLRRDDLGQGYDLILASAICHMLAPDENRNLFRRCAAAVAPGGRLVIRDFLLDPDRTSPPEATLFALNMLTATDHGNVYTEEEYRAWLTEAGFPHAIRHRNPEDILVASREPQA